MKKFIVCCPPEEENTYFNMSREELEKKYYLTSLDTELPFGEPFIFQGRNYRQCWKDRKMGVLVVKEFEVNPTEDTTDASYPTCPVCGDEDYDYSALDEEGEWQCANCKSTYKYEREIEVTFSTKLVKEHMIRSLEELQAEVVKNGTE